MPQNSADKKVTVTVDGLALSIFPGTYSAKELAALVGEQNQSGVAPKYASLSVGTASPLATQSSSIGANGSYTFLGGEVLTSVLGS
jgi:hypothetical protein